MKTKSYEMDMCHGPLLKKILIFSIPLMLSGILQLLFNAADIIVVGRYAGSTALAAVGSTSALINLLTNLFIGFSMSANVLVARYYGGGKDTDANETVHTALLLSILSGSFLTVLGNLFARPLLSLMGTPSDVLSQATLYMRLYFLGMPVILLYNFGSSILRAIGDTKRPLLFLGISGIINVILNLIFVICLHLGVAGVALATVLSQCLSAALIIKCLCDQKGCLKLSLKKLDLSKDKLLQIIQIGLPAGLQGTIFSLSNVLIQSSINTFGSVAIAGNTAASNIESFIYISMNTFYQTALTFTSQNAGGRQYHRITKVLICCECLVIATGILLGGSAYLFAPQLLSIYSSDASVIAFGLKRMAVICLSYALCGIMDVIVGSLRGLGYSILPMIVSLIGACGLRILWIFTVFKWYHSLFILYLSYPITWIITFIAHLCCYIFIKKKYFRNDLGAKEMPTNEML